MKACPVVLLVKLKTLADDCVKATPPNPMISIMIHAKKASVNVIDTISQNIL
jgi:hypothetical protein